MFFKSRKYIIVIIILIVSLITVYFSAVNRENTLAYDNVVGFVVKPFTLFMNAVSNKTTDFLMYFKDKRDLINKNYELDNKIMILEHENSKLKSYEIENERLRSLLDFKDRNPQHELVASTVISKDNSNYYKTFIIDKGTDDGISINMPVVGSKGLIGYIVEAGNDFSKVQTIIEGGSSVGCTVVRTNSIAVTEGDTLLLNEGLLRMIYVSKEMNIVEGDIIETSGLGQIYPPGILIGRVKEIKSDINTKSQYAIIKPVEDFDAIREVFVIVNHKIGGR